MKLYRVKDAETIGRAGYRATYVADIGLSAPADSAGVIVVNIPAATKTSPHLHSYLDELFVAMSRVKIGVDGKVLTLNTGDTVLVERGETHHMEALADGDAALIAVKLPNIKTDKTDR